MRRSPASKTRGPWPLLATLGLAAAPALGAPPIEVLPGTAACVSETGNGGICVDGKALDGANAVAVSPDGINVYVASATSGAVAVFDREPSTGALTQLAFGTQGCWSEDGSGGACSDGRGLQLASGVAVSPDGLNVYVSAAGGEGSLAVFDRNLITGALTQKAGTDGCISTLGSGGSCTDGDALAGLSAVAVSHDGRNVYATSSFSSAVAVFDRSLATGVLTQKALPDGCVSDSGGAGCANGFAL
jgi:DNA-binding beta-propeller fold protein YncE